MEGLTRETIKPLLELQRVDSASDRLHARRANLPEQQALDELTARRAEVAKAHTDRSGSLKEIVSAQTRLEGEVSMLEDKIKKESERLYSGEISNPKELAGIQAELDALRRRKSHVEDQLIEVMEGREAAEKEAGDHDAQLADLDRRIEEATAKRDEAAVDIAGELERLAGEREALRPGLPAELLELYDDIRKRKEGVAAAALEGNVCRGCNVELTPVAMDEIKRSDDPIIRCENCRRLLVIP